jgi:AcrR family transcriptional regulator
MYKNEIDTADTEHRLLQAAGEVFAEHGYRAATVRQICEAAGANVAAVNYYFGDKEKLYMAVLRSVSKVNADKYPPYALSHCEAPPEQQLRAYIHALLQRIFDEGRPGWHIKIMARELIEPTHGIDMIVEEGARPYHQALTAIVRALLGPCANPDAVRLCTLSILGQCAYYHHARQVIRRLYPEQRYGEEDIAQLAQHITAFSLEGLRQFTQERTNS